MKWNSWRKLGDTTRLNMEIPFSNARFMASHNSALNDKNSSMPSLVEQLDVGIRLLELDFYSADFKNYNDFRIGHKKPADYVVTGNGNPESHFLSDWLSVIDSWTTENLNHTPITIVLDIKDAIIGTSHGTRELGNLETLVEIICNSIKEHKIFSPIDLNGEDWPTVSDLLGRIIIVISGSLRSRELYRCDRGFNVSICTLPDHSFVEVHQSSRDNVWFWTGRYEDGEAKFIHHQVYGEGTVPVVSANSHGDVVVAHENAKQLYYRIGKLYEINSKPYPHKNIIWSCISTDYDPGISPAIAINDMGFVVEVHKSQNNEGIWVRLGTLQEDRIDWCGKSSRIGYGLIPSVKFPNLFENYVEILYHTDEGDMLHSGTISTEGGQISIEWSGPKLVFGKIDFTVEGNIIDENGNIIDNITVDRTNSPYGLHSLYWKTYSKSGAVRYPQNVFVDVQPKNTSLIREAELSNDLWFFSCNASDIEFAKYWDQQGKITRMWKFNLEEESSLLSYTPSTDWNDEEFTPNFPATDYPISEDYIDYCRNTQMRYE
eukprot:TRINITY_DN891_c0_g1_i3.p1 TRINITY_DN891_c0_g1~~TRINITY_DN891_c0_g1_i3.p1  ORF type:complete len:545 (+),score=109.59 TRINITY_DN891_c0_g1_i3:136-1770(+)